MKIYFFYDIIEVYAWRFFCMKDFEQRKLAKEFAERWKDKDMKKGNHNNFGLIYYKMF